MKHFEEGERKEFAESIAGAVGLTGTDYGNEFVDHFKGIQDMYGSGEWSKRVISWIASNSGKRSEIKNMIMKNSTDAKAVFNFIDENVHHF